MAAAGSAPITTASSSAMASAAVANADEPHLANDNLFHIFSFGSALDVARSGGVCRQWNRVSEQNQNGIVGQPKKYERFYDKEEISQVFAGSRKVEDLRNLEFYTVFTNAISEKDQGILKQIYANEKYLSNLSVEKLKTLLIKASEVGDRPTFDFIWKNKKVDAHRDDIIMSIGYILFVFAISSKHEELLNQLFANEELLANLNEKTVGKMFVTACEVGDLTTFGRIWIREALINEVSSISRELALYSSIFNKHFALFKIFVDSELIKQIPNSAWFLAANEKDNAYFETLMAKEGILPHLSGLALQKIIHDHDYAFKYPLDRIFKDPRLVKKIPADSLNYAFRSFAGKRNLPMVQLMLGIESIRSELTPESLDSYSFL